MRKIGFDKQKHPLQMQLRFCSIMDPGGIRSGDCTTIDFRDGRVTEYITCDEAHRTNVKEYTASDDESKELYAIFTLNALKEFEALSEEEKMKHETGYYDCFYLRYLLIGENGQLLEGKRRRLYSNDPIDKVLKWIHKTSPFRIG